MVTSLLTHIKDYILLKNPTTFQNGFAGGRLYQDGKVIKYTDGEGSYVGLGDTFSNYFYIREVGEVELDIAADTRTVSCKELVGVENCRLVAWVANGDLGKLEEVLLTDLMNVNFGSLSDTDKLRFSDIKMVLPATIMSDFEQIYKEETGQDEKVKARYNITLVAIDFALRFNYKAQTEACLDRSICNSCT